MTWELIDTIKHKLRGACNENAYFQIWSNGPSFELESKAVSQQQGNDQLNQYDQDHYVNGPQVCFNHMQVIDVIPSVCYS